MKTKNKNSFIKNNEIVTEEVIDAQSQFELGKKYYDKKDYKQAVFCFSKAAEQGNDDAQYRLDELGESW